MWFGYTESIKKAATSSFAKPFKRISRVHCQPILYGRMGYVHNTERRREKNGQTSRWRNSIKVQIIVNCFGCSVHILLFLICLWWLMFRLHSFVNINFNDQRKRNTQQKKSLKNSQYFSCLWSLYKLLLVMKILRYFFFFLLFLFCLLITINRVAIIFPISQTCLLYIYEQLKIKKKWIVLYL